MGVYSTNRLDIAGVNIDDIAANESYSGLVGIQKMLLEEHENDMSIFEAVLRNDAQEVVGVHEGTLLESELASLNEATISGILDVIKKGILDFIAKIKSIFETFKNKYLDTVEKANIELLNKVKGKIEKKDLSKFKYKWRDINTSFKFDTDTINKERTDALNEVSDATSVEQINEIIAKYNDSKLTEKLLGIAIGDNKATLDNFSEKFEESYFAGKEVEVTGLASVKLNSIIDDLGKYIPKEKTWLKSESGKLSNTAKAVLKQIDTAEKESKKAIGKDDKEAIALAAKTAEGLRLVINSWKSAYSHTIAQSLRMVKIRTSMSRSVITKAYMFNPKAVHEFAELFDAIDECAACEFEDALVY